MRVAQCVYTATIVYGYNLLHISSSQQLVHQLWPQNDFHSKQLCLQTFKDVFILLITRELYILYLINVGIDSYLQIGTVDSYCQAM